MIKARFYNPYLINRRKFTRKKAVYQFSAHINASFFYLCAQISSKLMISA